MGSLDVVQNSMNRQSFYRPFYLTLGFWVGLGILSVPVLWYSQPWDWNYPVVSCCSGIFLLPITAALITYVFYLCSLAAIRGDSRQNQIARFFVSAFPSVGAMLLAICWDRGFTDIPWWWVITAVAAVAIVNVAYLLLRRISPYTEESLSQKSIPDGFANSGPAIAAAATTALLQLYYHFPRIAIALLFGLVAGVITGSLPWWLAKKHSRKLARYSFWTCLVTGTFFGWIAAVLLSLVFSIIAIVMGRRKVQNA